MFKRSQNKFRFAPEMLKWRSNQPKVVEEVKSEPLDSEPVEPRSALPAQDRPQQPNQPIALIEVKAEPLDPAPIEPHSALSAQDRPQQPNHPMALAEVKAEPMDSEPTEPQSALPAQEGPQHFWRLKRPWPQRQPVRTPVLPNREAVWKSETAGEEYLEGRKLLHIHGMGQHSHRTETGVVKVSTFLCEFKDKTYRFIPGETIKKRYPKAVICYYESKMVMINP